MTTVVTRWEKPQRSETATCVQVRRNGAMIEIGDDKDPKGPTLSFTPAEIKAFLDSAKDGQFDQYATPVA